ncbi:uncharacterized protein J4E79_001568 [Alternaria viburni]|uniref:uncharacterized protein n=1 Tax=Alternaria viburni TaxID=566460 RepID=UPI0020C4B944|nr:uncharacterized protein J4E79_001568 [Alternaria viburni]KAI4669524.1 hypothetical protein J4E79_001568 [Alternaria viburni]
MATEQSGSGTHAPPTCQADKEPTMNIEDVTIEKLTERCRKVSFKVTHRILAISYRIPSSDDKYTSIIAASGSVRNQHDILVGWALRNGLIRLNKGSREDRGKPKPNDLSKNLLVNLKKGDEIRDSLQGIETTLGEMSEILEFLTRRYGADGSTPAPDTGDQETGLQLWKHVVQLACYNKKLLQCTKTLGDPGPPQTHLYKVLENDEDKDFGKEVVAENSHSATGAIEETKETAKVDIVALAQTCKSGYDKVIRVLKDANEEIEESETVRRIGVQGWILDKWIKQYQRKLLRDENPLHKMLLRYPGASEARLEWVQENKHRVENKLAVALRDIDKILGEISKVLAGSTSSREIPTSESDAESDSSSTKYDPELEALIDSLVENNKILWDEH